MKKTIAINIDVETIKALNAKAKKEQRSKSSMADILLTSALKLRTN